MFDENYPNLTRRGFIRQAACAAVGTLALKSTIRDLRLINSAMAFTAPTDYKALVCVFLSGGNDSNNWIIPTDPTTWDAYTAIRGNLAMPLDQLHTLHSTGSTPYSDTAGHTYAFHTACPELRQLFDEDKLAVIMNVGTLVRPTTRSQYLGSNSKFYQPPQLFSHSDQVTQWQTSIPDQPPATGWGGRIADLIDAIAHPPASPAGISMSVSLNGANTFEVGNLITQYHVSTNGAVTLSGLTNSMLSGSGARVSAMKAILSATQPNLQRSAYADVLSDAIVTGDALNTNIDATKEPSAGGTWQWTTPFPNTTLGNQLKMVARLIQARGPFNMKRQIFFTSVGGYDTHTSQVSVNGTDQPTNSNGAHYKLLNEVSTCMFAFERAMEQLGIADKVTAFTNSDFSRTLPTNSQGSDHGWGAHHIIVGGGVKGGATYGALPTFALNGPDDTGLGRWIPTLAVDQFSARLARWFGLSNSDLQTVFPNLTRFASNGSVDAALANIDFMQPVT